MPIRRLVDFADTCVFSKQSSGPILCDPFRLRPRRASPTGGSPSPEVTGTVCRVPWPRLTRAPEAPRLAHLCRFAVRSAVGPRPRSFSRQRAYGPFTGPEGPFGLGARPRGTDLPVPVASLPPLHRAPRPDGPVTAASLHELQRSRPRYGNVDPFPIGYASRPRLRGRLTLS